MSKRIKLEDLFTEEERELDKGHTTLTLGRGNKPPSRIDKIKLRILGFWLPSNFRVENLPPNPSELLNKRIDARMEHNLKELERQLDQIVEDITRLAKRKK